MFLKYKYDDPLRLRMTDADDDFIKLQIPLYDNENNPLTMEYGLCKYKDV